MKFQLVKKSSNQVVAKFHVTNSDGDICGSINVSPSEEADLLSHWSGSKPQAQMSSQKNPNKFVEAMMKRKQLVMSQASILRGCC